MLPLGLFRKVCMRLPRLSFSSAANFVGAQTCMADTSVVYFYTDFVRFWCFNLNVFDREVFACFPGYGSLARVNHVLPCLHWKSDILCRLLSGPRRISK